MLRKILAVLLILAAVLLVFECLTVYVVRRSAGGGLYWNADQALLIITGSAQGARMSYLRYTVEPFVEMLGDIRQPSDQRCSEVLVIQVTDQAVQHYETDLWRYAEEPYCDYRVAPFGGEIYVGYLAQDKLWKWSKDHFEKATAEELQAFHEAKAGEKALSHPSEFDKIEGWSMRGLGQTSPENEIVIDNRPAQIVFHGRTWPPKPLSLQLIRSGEAPQTIWSLNEEPQRVTRSEYDRVFGKP